MKTKLRKKLVCAVLSVCMAASMAACGSDSSSATAASSGANHHTPEFDIAEEGLLYGVAAALGYVLNYLGVRRIFPDFSPSQEAWKI